MTNIIKPTQGDAAFTLREEFADQDKAGEGKEPLDSEVIIDDLKIENIKYKLKEVLKDDSDWSENNSFRKKA